VPVLVVRGDEHDKNGTLTYRLVMLLNPEQREQIQI
jgi:hypothetical protein